MKNNNKKKLGIIGLLLICPLGVACSSNEYKKIRDTYSEEYVNFSINDLEQLPNSSGDLSYNYSITIKNTGSGFITDFWYIGDFDTFGINREGLDTIPINETLLLQPETKEKYLFSYQSRKNASVDLTKVKADAYVYPAEKVRISGSYQLSPTDNPELYHISCNISVFEAKGTYDYKYVVTMSYDQHEYAFETSSGSEGLYFSIRDGFDASKAEVKSIKAFRERDTGDVTPPPSGIGKKVFVIVLASLAFGATVAAVVLTVRQYLNKKK